MRITKESAEVLSKKLSEKYLESLKKVKSELSEYVTAEYIKDIPAPVIKIFASESAYFRKDSRIMLSGEFGHQYIPATKSVPNDQYTATLTLTKERINKISGLIKKRDDLEKKYKDIKGEIYQALIALGTYKRISDQFPEAAIYLPQAQTMALTIDINKVRSYIK